MVLPTYEKKWMFYNKLRVSEACSDQVFNRKGTNVYCCAQSKVSGILVSNYIQRVLTVFSQETKLREGIS